MCGIAGLVLRDTQANVSEEVLRRMTAAMSYRGPDDEGYYTRRNVGLGFRRLSIIDLAAGHQPMSDEDGTVWIVFNGEIYNFRELRSSLEARGYRFRTHTDTEVLVHLYKEYGRQCVEYLRGMFAFAIYDVRADKLFLARDRFGKKPLFYMKSGDRLVFGSELKVILESGDVSREVNPSAIASYFTYGYIVGSQSIFSGIEKCPPAHFMEYDCASGRMMVQRYWTPSFVPDFNTTEEEWTDRIRQKFGEAVKSRLVSDVPLGAFLSGGIDSSSVVALMARYCDQPVKTFSIGFKEQEFNELQYAREIVRLYGTDHHEQILEPESVDLLPKVVGAFDEPFSDPSAIPTYYVSRFAREHVTVCLSGDGGDELFAGYDDYQKQLRIHRYNRLPAWIRTSLWGGLHKALPDRFPGKGLTYLLLQDRKRSPAYYSIYTKFDRLRLFSKSFSERFRHIPAPESLKEALLSECSSPEFMSCLQYLDISSWLVDDVLCKVDRMSMLNSLEVRSPLLDHEFAQLAFQIPAGYRIRGGDKKYIFKQAMKEMLPAKVLGHRKQGFGVPLKLWFRHDLKEYMHDRLYANNVRLSQYLDIEFVRKIVRDHEAGMRDLNRKVWSILVFDAWLEQYT